MTAILLLIVFALMVCAPFVFKEAAKSKVQRLTHKVKALLQPAFSAVKPRVFAAWVVLSGALTPFFAPMVAHAQSASISLDMTPFFTALNTYLPTFVSIFGLIGGIAAALGFAKYIIGTIVNALRGGSFS